MALNNIELGQTEMVRNISPTSSMTIGLLTLLIVLPMLATDIYLPSLPQVAVDLAANHATVMLTLTAYMIGYAFSLVLSGMASDRYGRRPVIMLGITLFCVSSFACAFADSITTLISFRFLQALGGGCGTLLARVVVRDLFDYSNQVRVLSYLSAGLALSPTLGPILGGYLATAFGWRAPFFFVAALSCVAWLVTFFLLKETCPVENRHRISVSSVLTQYRMLLTHRTFIAYTLIISLAWSVYFSFLASSSFILQKIFGLSQIEFGFAFALVIAGYVAGTIVTRKQIGRRSIDGLIRGASLALVLSTSLIVTVAWSNSPNLFLLLFLVAVALAGVGVIFPTTQAAVMQPFSKNVGLVAGLFYATEMSFGAITSWTLGHFRGDSPLPMSIVMAVSAMLLFIIVHYILPAKQHAEKISAAQKVGK